MFGKQLKHVHTAAAVAIWNRPFLLEFAEDGLPGKQSWCSTISEDWHSIPFSVLLESDLAYKPYEAETYLLLYNSVDVRVVFDK